MLICDGMAGRVGEIPMGVTACPELAGGYSCAFMPPSPIEISVWSFLDYYSRNWPSWLCKPPDCRTLIGQHD